MRKLDVVPKFIEMVMRGRGIPIIQGYASDGKPQMHDERPESAIGLARHYKDVITRTGDGIILIG